MPLLTQQVVVDKIEILQEGQLQLRMATVILSDGVEISRTYQRAAYVPGDDVTGLDAKVQAVAAATWTPAVVAAFKAAHPAPAPVSV